jgi:DNA-binding NtrC family response regulator
MGGESTQGDLSHADRWLDGAEVEEHPTSLGLAIAWCLSDPGRVGEVALVPPEQTVCIGRDPGAAPFLRIRPRGRRPTAPLEGRLLSRRQLEVRASGEGLEVVNVGSCALKVGGAGVDGARLRVGDALELDRQLVLVAVRRTPMPDVPDDPPFGRPDESGIVGESPAAWQLRARLRFLARRDEAVLVLGPSGTGKELAARAIHAGSSRGRGPFVARNAATIPEGLVDAELFGNARGYPNPGMPDRPGLVGAADGGTLFLDEIGEMPAALQAHLLRVLDRDGAYQRLGEVRERRASFRFVAATHRDPESLKHDLLARLALRLEVPGLEARPEDVPLLVRHLLRDARRDPELADRLFDGDDARISPDLVLALLGHRWTTHVRELASLLWLSIETSPGRALLLTPEVRGRLEAAPGAEAPAAAEIDVASLRAGLAAAGGSVSRAAQALGVSRFALYRLMRKHGIGP